MKIAAGIAALVMMVSPVNAGILSPGDHGVLIGAYSGGGREGKWCPVMSDYFAMSDYEKALVAHDNQEVVDLVNAGRAVTVPAGTRVLVIDRVLSDTVFIYEVRIIDTGIKGWVYGGWITRK
jgi:hypothetical protein